jgi:hypothetical protein
MDEYLFNEIADEETFAKAVKSNFKLEIDKIENDKTPFNFSKRHENQMDKLLKQKKTITISVFINRFVTVAAVIVIFMSGVLLTVPEIRAVVGNTFSEWFNKEQVITPPEPIEIKNYQINYIPNGFNLTKKHELNGVNSINYTDTDGNFLVFSYTSENSEITVNNENTMYKTYVENGIVYQTFTAVDDYTFIPNDTPENEYSIPNTKNAPNSILWENNDVKFAVEGQLPISELLKIAKSVELSEN